MRDEKDNTGEEITRFWQILHLHVYRYRSSYNLLAEDEIRSFEARLSKNLAISHLNYSYDLFHIGEDLANGYPIIQKKVIEKFTQEIDRVNSNLGSQDEDTLKNTLYLCLTLFSFGNFIRTDGQEVTVASAGYSLREVFKKFNILINASRKNESVLRDIYYKFRENKRFFYKILSKIEELFKNEATPSDLILFYQLTQKEKEIEKLDLKEFAVLSEKLAAPDSSASNWFLKCALTLINRSIPENKDTITTLLLNAKRLMGSESYEPYDQLKINLNLYAFYIHTNQHELADALFEEIKKAKETMPNAQIMWIYFENIYKPVWKENKIVMDKLIDQACFMADPRELPFFAFIHLKQLEEYLIPLCDCPAQEYKKYLPQVQSKLELIKDYIPKIENANLERFDIRELLLYNAFNLLLVLNKYNHEFLSEYIMMLYSQALKQVPIKLNEKLYGLDQHAHLFIWYYTQLAEKGEIDKDGIKQIVDFKSPSSDLLYDYYKLGKALAEKGDLLNAKLIFYKALDLADSQNRDIVCEDLAHYIFQERSSWEISLKDQPYLFIWYHTQSVKNGKINPERIQQIIDFKPPSSNLFSIYHKLGKALAEKGDLVNAENIFYKALGLANSENCKIVCEDIVRYIFHPSQSADVKSHEPLSITDARDKNGRTLLHHCAERNITIALSLLVNEKNADAINVPDCDGNTPLHLAAKNGSVDWLDKLIFLDEATKKDQRPKEKKQFNPTFQQHDEKGQTLLEHGMHQRNLAGKTPLDLAAESKDGRSSPIYKKIYSPFFYARVDREFNHGYIPAFRRAIKYKAQARPAFAANRELEEGLDIEATSRAKRWIQTLNRPLSIPTLEKQRELLKKGADKEMCSLIDKKINQKIEKLKKLSKEEYQLIVAREKLHHAIQNLTFDYYSATQNTITGDALCSRKVMADSHIDYKEGYGLMGKWEHYYNFGHWLPRGSRPYPFVKQNENSKVYIIDGDLLAENAHFFLRDDDPSIYQYTEEGCDSVQNFQFGNVHYSKRFIDEKGTKYKVITVTGPHGKTREFRYPFRKEIIQGKFNKEMIANDVDELIGQIASVDIQSALDLLKSDQPDLASELCRKVNQYEASVVSHTPFRLTNSLTSDQKEICLLREVHRIDTEEVIDFYRSIKFLDIVKVGKIIDKCQLQTPKPDPEHPDAVCYVNKFIVDAYNGEYSEYGKPLILAIDRFHLFNDSESIEERGKAKAIIELLLTKNADINGRSTLAAPETGHPFGYDALMYAALLGELEIVQLLVEKGANINACMRYTSQPNETYNALRLAQSKGHTEIVKYLISKGARNVDGSIPGQASECIAEKAETDTAAGKASVPIQESKTASYSQQTLDDINALTRLMCEMKSDKGCDARVEGNNLIFNFDIHVEYDEGGVHFPNAPIIPHALGARLFFSDKDPILECREYKSLQTHQYCVPLTGKIKHEDTPHDHDGFRSLEAVRDRLMTRELDTLLTCAQNYDYFLTHGKKHPKTGDGATSSFNKHRFRNIRLTGFKIKARTLPDQTIGIVVLENSEKESHVELVMKQLQRHLNLNDDQLAINEITINRNGKETLAKQITIKLTSSALIDRLKEKRTNFHGVLLVDDQGRIALANRKNDYETVSKGYAGAGGHCTHPYSEQLGVFTELRHEFNLEPQDESKSLERSELIAKTRNKALWLVHANAVKTSDSSAQYTRDYKVPFKADSEEFIPGTECYLSFQKIRENKLPLRNISSLDLYLEFEQKRINKTIEDSTEFKECKDVQIKIPKNCQIEGLVRIPDNDFGIIRLDVPDDKKDQIPKFLSLLPREVSEKLEIRNGNEIVNVNPYTFYELIRKIALAQRKQTVMTASSSTAAENDPTPMSKTSTII